ncbi:MAG: peptide deformylase [Chloroflexi bacterium]|nr:peptide deformylase [Chloroflexota bacterium]
MSIRTIITPKNPILRRKARRVTDFASADFQAFVDDMVETMLDAPGVGLAAPQVAVSQRVIVVRLPDDEDSREEYGEDAGVLYVVINPEIIRASRDTTEGVEACLSIPGYFGKVDRYTAVTVQGHDRHGKPMRIKAKDWLARVFQHEIDHLDGVLFIDHATEIWRDKNQMPEEDPLSLEAISERLAIREGEISSSD